MAARAALVARWANTARELVDAPPNVIRPPGSPSGPRRSPACGLRPSTPPRRGSARWSRSATAARPAVADRAAARAARRAGRSRLGLVGKAVTFDSGGYFLKPQADIVRQKADMGGGAAVVAALGAIAELGIPLSVTGVVPACENMLSGSAMRPSDVIKTAAGLTVEVTNPDAEGRLILADALWWARRDGATHVVDLATLTGALRAGMGDLYAGVFPPRRSRGATPSSKRGTQRRLAGRGRSTRAIARCFDSTVADLRNTAGRSASATRSWRRRSCSSSRVKGLGHMSTCSVLRCLTRIGATRSAAVRPATGCACSSSSPRA